MAESLFLSPGSRKDGFPRVKFISPYRNQNHSFAVVSATERLVVESACVWGRCRRLGSRALEVRPERGSLRQAGEHVMLGCPSNISAPGRMSPGDKASADDKSLVAILITRIPNIIFESVSHKWKEL